MEPLPALVTLQHPQVPSEETKEPRSRAHTPSLGWVSAALPKINLRSTRVREENSVTKHLGCAMGGPGSRAYAISFDLRMGHDPHFTESEVKWLAQGYSGSKWWRVTQILASLTSKPVIFHHSTLEPPSLDCAPRMASQTPLTGKGLPRRPHRSTVAPVTKRAALRLVSLVWYCIYPVMAMQQLLTEYKQRVKSYFFNNSQYFVHTFQLWSMDHRHQRHLGYRLK